ncbi:hypothetical protein LINGRAHAP2_LOCUS23136 [Linum grandiflorum]
MQPLSCSSRRFTAINGRFIFLTFIVKLIMLQII